MCESLAVGSMDATRRFFDRVGSSYNTQCLFRAYLGPQLLQILPHFWLAECSIILSAPHKSHRSLSVVLARVPVVQLVLFVPTEESNPTGTLILVEVSRSACFDTWP
jgi:hypothetical protein